VGRDMAADQVAATAVSGDLISAGIFICGHPKSGTSLLMTLLDSHPQLVVFPEETGFFRRFIPEAQGLSWEDQIRLAETLILHIFQWNQHDPPESQRGFPDRDYSEISYDAVLATFHALMNELAPALPSILSAAILAYGLVARRVGEETTGWAEKTPYNEYFADKIFTYWPRSRCIHIIRDPRDNYASYRRKHPDWTPEAFARSWLTSTRSGWRNARRFGERRYMLMRYEDLVMTTEETLAGVIDFLQIRGDPILRQPTRAGKPWGGNSMFGDRFAGVSPQPVARYRDALESAEVLRLEGALYPEMRKLGYVLENRDSVGLRTMRFRFLARLQLSRRLRRFRARG